MSLHTDAESHTSTSRLAHLVTRSAMHIGCGEALGDIDQPVARQPSDKMPYVPGPALKRSVKDHAALDAETQALLFGNDQGRPGHLAPQDAGLLLLPVASGAGAQAWVTSPSLLVRYYRKAALCSVSLGPWPDAAPEEDQVILTETTSPLVLAGTDPQVVQLGEYRLNAKQAAPALGLFLQAVVAHAFAHEAAEWQQLVASRMAVVHDAMMLTFGSRLDVRTRNTIGPDGVAANIWREECVPEDTVFYAPFVAQPADSTGQRTGLALARQWLGELAHNPLMLQVGGNASLGQGWARLHLGHSPARAEVQA